MRRNRKNRHDDRYKQSVDRTQRDRRSPLSEPNRLLRRPSLSDIQDFRRFTPERSKHELTLESTKAHYRLEDTTRQGTYYRNLTHRIGFSEPGKTVTCIRRKQRRVSLFARGHVGRGKRIRTPKRYKESSKVRC